MPFIIACWWIGDNFGFLVSADGLRVATLLRDPACATLQRTYGQEPRMKLWLLSSLCLLSACVAEPAKYHVDVCGDVLIPRDVDAYRVVVLDADLERELASGAEDLVLCPGDVPVSLPRTTSFDAEDGDAWIRLQGLRQGVVVSTFDRRVRASESEDVSVTVGMTRACLGIMCPKGQTCYDGVCKAAEFSSDSSVCTSQVAPTVEPPEPTPVCPSEEL